MMPIERAYVASLYGVMFDLLLEKCDTKTFPLNDQIQYNARIYEPELQQLIEISAETAQLSYLKEDAYAHLEEFKTGRIPPYDEQYLYLHLNVILDAPELVPFHFDDATLFRKDFLPVFMKDVTWFFNMLLGGCISHYLYDPETPITNTRENLLNVLTIIKEIASEELGLPSTTQLFQELYLECKNSRLRSYAKVEKTVPEFTRLISEIEQDSPIKLS